MWFSAWPRGAVEPLVGCLARPASRLVTMKRVSVPAGPASTRAMVLFGLASNPTLARHVAALETSTAARFKTAPTRGKVRRFTQFNDAAESWSRVERTPPEWLEAAGNQS